MTTTTGLMAAMPKIDIDSVTDSKLAFAGAVAGVSKGEIIARLVSAATPEMFASPPSPPDGPTGGGGDEKVVIYCDYQGFRTHAHFDTTTHRVDVIDGPLVGESYKTPSAAACAVVAHANPAVSANRNGWGFWRIDGSGDALQTIR